MVESTSYPREDAYTANVFGNTYRFQYSIDAIAFAVVAMRIAMGWIFLQAGLTKVFDPDWTAAGYLNNAVPEGNPFMDFWSTLAGSPLIDFMNQWGLTLVGLALLLGIFVRFSAFWGAVIMLFYWLSGLSGGLADFLPVAHGYVVDEHIVYIVLLFGLGALGAGRVLGIDALLEKTDFVQSKPWLRYLLG
jgi:thiosulfate dehydrogenase [quinone] large subunit